MRATWIPVFLVILLLAGSTAYGAEDGVGKMSEADRLSSKAVTIYANAVKTWVAVYKQMQYEPAMEVFLEDFALEQGFKGYRSFVDEAKVKLGTRWDEIVQKEFRSRWTRARVSITLYFKKVAENVKSGKADHKNQDKMVIVYLKNGSSIEGIARKGVLSEKVFRVRRIDAKKVETVYIRVPRIEREAGIRVWYINNVEGFNFIPYSLVEKKDGVEVVRTLTQKESERIFKEIKKKEQALRTAERIAKAEEARLEGERSEASRVLREAMLARKKGVDIEKARKERNTLLSRFPPTGGWSAKRRDEIRRRWIINHVPPNAKERDFLALFDKWKTAKTEQDIIDGKKKG